MLVRRHNPDMLKSGVFDKLKAQENADDDAAEDDGDHYDDNREVLIPESPFDCVKQWQRLPSLL